MKTRTIKTLFPLIVLGFLLTFSTGCDDSGTENPPAENGQVTDADGNVYSTVTIGTQVWMVENLKTTKLNDGTAISLGETWTYPSTPTYCWYNSDIANKGIYGALYNWYAVNTGKLAPTGWHIPTYEDWTTLENYLIANGYNYDGTSVGNKYAKSLSATTTWTSSMYTGVPGSVDYPTFRNKSGFNAVPAGVRIEIGEYYHISNATYWWSSTEISAKWAEIRSIVYNAVDVSSGSYSKSTGLSVRCIKN